MLDRIDPCGDQFRHIPGRGMRRDPGTSAVNRLDQTLDVGQRVGGRRRGGGSPGPRNGKSAISLIQVAPA